MKSDNKMPGDNRDYPESDVSDNEKKSGSMQEQQSQFDRSQNDKDTSKGKRKPVYIKDMPEIKPAIPDQGV